MKTIILLFLLTGLFGFSATSGGNHLHFWPKVSNIQVAQKSNSVSITWEADGEQQDLYYEIERSTDGVQFKTAAIVLTGFESNNSYSYFFREKAGSSKIIYRIKQLKKDGSFNIVAERTL
jgi:hypothetical protein